MPLHGQNLFGALTSLAILGPGLMGSSLGMALLEKFPGLDIRIWARREAAARAAARVLKRKTPGARCLGTTSLERAVDGAHMVVFCVPVGVMPGLARELAPYLAADAVCTDVGSVKAGVVKTMEGIFGGRFVGAHPMAGSERSGLEAGRADLYQGANCILTPTDRTLPGALEEVSLLWLQAGCSLIFASPSDHDAAVARVSHLPHLLSSLLVGQMLQLAAGHEAFAGSGFRDVTRLAGGPPEMWAGILRDNREEVLRALDEFGRQLDRARAALKSPRSTALLRLLTAARDHRNSLYP